MIMLMMATWQIKNHKMNMLELMMKPSTCLLKHMWLLMMWASKVNLILNLTLNLMSGMSRGKILYLPQCNFLLHIYMTVKVLQVA